MLVPAIQTIVQSKEHAIETRLTNQVRQRGWFRQPTLSVFLKTCVINFCYKCLVGDLKLHCE